MKRLEVMFSYGTLWLGVAVVVDQVWGRPALVIALGAVATLYRLHAWWNSEEQG